MADPTSPSLPSTADAVPYVPVSWMAVAAITVSGVFAVALVGLGLVAFTSKKPLLEDWLLVMPVVAIVLSFAARRVIRNSEGTRTGENLTNYAWWIALVLGLCYVAYLFAIDFAIRRDARGEVDKWMGTATAGTPKDIRAAFYRTIPPGQRQGVSPDDEYGMSTRFRDELLAFRSTDLMRVVQRNKGEVEFASGAVNWSHKPGVVEGVLNGTLKCPEGTFPLVVPFKGVEGVTGPEGGGGGRQWMIAWAPGGSFFDTSRVSRTEYGWLLAALESDGGAFGKGFVLHLGAGPNGHPFAYRGFIAPGGEPAAWGPVAFDRVAQLGFSAPARVVFGDAGYADYMANHFYKREGGADASPDYKARFFASFNTQGVRPAGDRLKDASGAPVDKEDFIAVTDQAVEVRVPVEIPILGTGKVEAARGRLLVTCTDPALLAELKRLKAAANPAMGLPTMPESVAGWTKRVTWRVVRVESDMVPVNAAPRGRGGPGGPGEPPG